MAILVEGISVVIRAEAVIHRYPGGWERFRDDCPNDTLCADGELIRVGFPHVGMTGLHEQGTVGCFY
jgi:hypothetical protein